MGRGIYKIDSQQSSYKHTRNVYLHFVLKDRKQKKKYITATCFPIYESETSVPSCTQEEIAEYIIFSHREAKKKRKIVLFYMHL